MNKGWAHAALFGASLIYGINYSVAKGVMPHYLEPLGFIFTRISGAVLLFWLFHGTLSREKVQRKDLFLLAASGFFGVFLNQSLFFLGLNQTTPINASIIMTVNPILVLIASSLILKERLTTKKWSGIGVGLVGALLVIALGKNIHFGSDTFMGDLLVFLNAASYGVYLVIVKPLMKKYRPLTVIKWVFFFGFLFILPFGGNQFLTTDWQSFTPAVWYAVAFVVLGTTFLTYLLNIYALKRVNPSVVSIYIYTQPIIASFVAIGLGMDSLDMVKIVSAALIFLGVYLISTK